MEGIHNEYCNSISTFFVLASSTMAQEVENVSEATTETVQNDERSAIIQKMDAASNNGNCN